MQVFEIIIALLLAGAVLASVSRRLAVPYPAMVALAGAGLALVPGIPTIVLDPDLALTLFVAPVLLDAAFDAPRRDLRIHWRAVASLAVGAVAVTVAAVAAVARLLVPAMPWSAAIALGAIVAPPDAAAASAVLKQLRPPHRLMVILEGESLFNDASALLVYRLAVSASAAGAISLGRAIPTLLVVTAGSVVLGLALSRAFFAVTRRAGDVAIAVVGQFCGTFAVWMIADRLGLSSIITMVVFAMASARVAARETPARMRIPSYAFWEIAVFVLNVLAFILVGLQLKAILARIDRPTLLGYTGVAAAVCAATILSRFAYLAAAIGVRALRERKLAQGEARPSRRSAVVVAWSGMRGIVTLAAALALPTSSRAGATSEGFPCRDLIVFCAFAVVLVTLVAQGMTLRPLIRSLRLEDDGSVEREAHMGRVETLRAALGALEGLPRDAVSDVLRRRYELMLASEDGAVTGGDGSAPMAPGAAPDGSAAIVRTATSAEREKLLTLHEAGIIGGEAFQRIEQQLDWEELFLDDVTGAAGGTRAERRKRSSRQA